MAVTELLFDYRQRRVVLVFETQWPLTSDPFALGEYPDTPSPVQVLLSCAKLSERSVIHITKVEVQSATQGPKIFP